VFPPAEEHHWLPLQRYRVLKILWFATARANQLGMFRCACRSVAEKEQLYKIGGWYGTYFFCTVESKRSLATVCRYTFLSRRKCPKLQNTSHLTNMLARIHSSGSLTQKSCKACDPPQLYHHKSDIAVERLQGIEQSGETREMRSSLLRSS